MLIDALTARVSPSIPPMPTAESMADSEPATRPIEHGRRLLMSDRRFLYMGMAKATVAGPSNEVMMSLAGAYCSTWIPPRSSANMTIGVLKKTGVVSGDG
jgi:hypothetical protein